MNCNQVRDLILTDYLDDRLSGRILDEFKAHLLKCADCREFEQLAHQAAIEPFKGLTTAKTPEAVWQNVRERIAEEDRRFSPSWVEVFGNFWENLLGLRPVAAWVGICSVLILTLAVGQHVSRQKVLKAQDKEKVEYLAFLLEYSETATQNGNSGYGTDIEAMFL